MPLIGLCLVPYWTLKVLLLMVLSISVCVQYSMSHALGKVHKGNLWEEQYLHSHMLEEHFRHLGPIEKWCATKADGATAATRVGRCGKSRGIGGTAAGSYWWPPNFIVSSSGNPGVNFGKKRVLTSADGLKNNLEACRQLQLKAALPPPARDGGHSCGKIRDIPRTRRECRRERVPAICLNGDTYVAPSGSGAYSGLLR
ncbi:hypothetical protein B0H11DRAFT_2418217 [Mycena galericulata]|nr:hypothetical protein B0H11DRAFT_2418217 [Mycena galericulata]